MILFVKVTYILSYIIYAFQKHWENLKPVMMAILNKDYREFSFLPAEKYIFLTFCILNKPM